MNILNTQQYATTVRPYQQANNKTDAIPQQAQETLRSPVTPAQIQAPEAVSQATTQEAAATYSTPAATQTQQPSTAAVTEELSPSEVAGTMSVASNAQRATVNSSSNLAELYRFSNKYYYGTSNNTWAKIDTSGDGDWSRDELLAYAADYEKATGRTLDVDALMVKYSDTGDVNGTIKYSGQQQMYQDDALGITRVKDSILLAEYYGTSTGSTGGTGGSGGTTVVNKEAFNTFVNKFTYGSANKLYAKIDQNEDGYWTMDEMVAYGKAYERATGIQLDVEAIFAKYDVDGTGKLGYFEQNAMYKDDALGLSRISDMMKAEAAESKNQDKLTDTSLSNSIQKYTSSLSSLSASSKSKLFQAFDQSMQKAALLDAFTMTNSFINGRNSSTGIYSAWNMGRMAMMGMFV